MNKKNKGLADNQEGEFILNESGTSVNTDKVETTVKSNEEKTEDDEALNDSKIVGDTHDE